MKPSLHTIGRDTIVTVMDKNTPAVLWVAPGDIVVVDCIDGYGGLIKSAADTAVDITGWDSINPCTGPIAVETAEPGDVLAVDILAVDVASEGYAVTFTDCGLIASELDEAYTTIGHVVNERVCLPYSDDVSVPIHPLIGTFGVAPAGEPVPTVLSGDHGGNMDLNDVCAGSTVYLPVSAPGGLLSLGDAKAALGDGELGANSLEIDIVATLRLRVIKGHSLERPIVETRERFSTAACADNVMDALKQATRDMMHLVQRKLGISQAQAHHFVSLAGSARPGNMINDIRCMSVAMPKAVFRAGIKVP